MKGNVYNRFPFGPETSAGFRSSRDSAGVHSIDSNRSSDGFSSQCPLTSQRHKNKDEEHVWNESLPRGGFSVLFRAITVPWRAVGREIHLTSYPASPPARKEPPWTLSFSSPPLGNLENQKRDEDAGRKSAGFPAHSNGRNKYANVLAFASNTSCLEFFSWNGH